MFVRPKLMECQFRAFLCTSQNYLEEYYGRCLKTYRRIYERAGIPEVILKQHTMDEVCSFLNVEKEDYHYKGLNMERDVPSAEYHYLAKSFEGSICSCCGKELIHVARGMEVGNIF